MDFINIPYSPNNKNNISNIQRNIYQKKYLIIKGIRNIKDKNIYKIKIYKNVI
jgi:hypothetical protein